MTKTQAQRRNHVERTPVPIEQRRGRGQPTKYEEAVTIQTAKRLAEGGATDQEIAAELGVSVQTIYNWCVDHPDFFETLRAAKAVANQRVEQSLYKRAVGYSTIENKLHQGRVVPVLVHVAGEPGAQAMWLKNKDRGNWRDNTDVSIVVPEGSITEPEDQNTRTLALAALALFGDAVGEPVEQHSITIEENGDGSQAEAERADSDSPQRARRSRRAPRAPAGDSDFEF